MRKHKLLHLVFPGFCPKSETEWLKFLQLKVDHDSRYPTQCPQCVRSKDYPNSRYPTQVPHSARKDGNSPESDGDKSNESGNFPRQADSVIGAERSATEMTWHGISQIMLKTLGAENSLTVLQSVSIPEGALSMDFFQQCVTSVLVDKQQR